MPILPTGKIQGIYRFKKQFNEPTPVPNDEEVLKKNLSYP